MSTFQLSHAIQDESLMTIEFDPSNMMNAMTEIVNIFRGMRDRITHLEEAQNTFVTMDSFNTLEANFLKLTTDIGHEFESVREKIATNHEEAVNSLKALQEWGDTQHLAIIGESRRLVTSEIRELPSPTQITEQLSEKMADVDRKIAHLSDVLEDLNLPAMSPAPVDSGAVILRLSDIDKRIDGIESRIVSYPQVESDVSSLLLQFPANNRRFDKRLNDVLEILRRQDSGLRGSFPDSLEMMPFPVVPPTPPPEPPQSEKVIIDATVPTGEVLERIDPADVSQTFKVPTTASGMPLPESLVIPQPIVSKRTSEDGPILQVFETHTYKTEMNASLRVVSELEWAKTMIQKHHDAIRQTQQNIRAQEESVAALTENTARMHATLNQRLAQIAQQILKEQQDKDENKRQFMDQLNVIRQKMSTPAFPPPPEVPVQQILQPGIQKPSSASSRGWAGRTILPILPGLESPHSDPELQKPPTPQAPAPRVEPAVPEAPEPAPAVLMRTTPSVPRRPRHMTWTMSHFHTNIRGNLGQMLMTEIHSQKDNPFATIEIYTGKGLIPAMASQQLPERTVTKMVPVYQAARTEEEPTTVHVPIESPVVEPSPGKLHQEIIQIGFPRMVQRAAVPTFDFDQISNDMIEDKVAVIARKTVTLLAEAAKNDLMKQAREVQRIVDNMITKIEGKIDRDFVERMFNKFRVMLNDVNEKIENIQCSFLEWVTRDELEIVLEKFLSVVRDVNDAAGTNRKYHCLLCGKPKAHLAGMSLVPAELMPEDSEPTTSKRRARKKYPPPDYLQETVADGVPPPRNVVQYLTS